MSLNPAELDLAGLRRETRRLIGNPEVDEAGVSNDYLDNLLQRALEALNRRAAVVWRTDTAIVTVANVQEYKLPPHVVRVDWIYAGGTPLHPADFQLFLKRYVLGFYAAASSQPPPPNNPAEYVIYDRKLFLFPAPDKAYQVTMRVVSSPQRIPSEGPPDLCYQDVTCLPFYAGALFHASDPTGDPQRSQALMAMFEAEAQLIAKQQADRMIQR